MNTVTKLSKMLINREISATELTKYYLDKEDRLGAFLHRCTTQTLKCAKRVDDMRAKGENLHPLAGIPIAVKDNIITKNVPTTCASRTLEGYIPPYNATVIEKINTAGMPLLGKTNMDEFAMGSTGENSAFFSTKNPRDENLVPGGSSSGSAAAVAGELAPIALGSDTGGSVRLPAAFCGVVGFKPSYGAISRFGLISFASSLDQIGIISNTAEDASLVFELISGKDGRDMTGIELEDKILCKPNVKKLEEVINSEIFDLLLPMYYIISSAEAYSNLSRYDGIFYGKDSAFGAEVKRRIELGNFVLSAENVGEYYQKACSARAELLRETDIIFSDCDFVIMSTSSGDVPKLGQVKNGCDMYEMDKYTVLANLAYLPAITLPQGESSITILARRGYDRALLSFAQEVEAYGI